jgi:2-methylcitrate dehydratase PrpD
MNVMTDIAAGLTRALSEQARTLTFADLPADVRTLARQCVLDYIACTLAGAKDELADILLAEATEQGGKPVATVIGHTDRLPVLSAALVNGAASHALDYDDVNLAMTGHPSVVLLSALLALAEERGSSGADVITAFVAGYELQCRLGLALAPGHYNVLGFHATGTLGSFGAAAACAHLLELDADRFAIALGIAGTQAAGLKSMFGTMCKPLHAGTASEHGLRAARLAAKGFTARSDSLECDQGFASSQSDHLNAEAALGEPPAGWHLRNNLFKYHAACYLTHAPIECAKEIRLKSNFPPERVKKILLRLDAAADKVCNIPNPTTGLEAKFSLRQTVAMALSGVNTASLESYNAAITQEPRIKALRDKVAIDFRTEWPHALAEMAIQLDDGTTIEATHDSGVPWADAAKQRQALETKFDSLVTPVLGAAGTRRLHDAIERIDTLSDVGELARASTK